MNIKFNQNYRLNSILEYNSSNMHILQRNSHYDTRQIAQCGNKMVEEILNIECDNFIDLITATKTINYCKRYIYSFCFKNKNIIEIIITKNQLYFNYIINNPKYNNKDQYYYHKSAVTSDAFDFEYIENNQYNLNLILNYIDYEKNILTIDNHINLNWIDLYFENDDGIYRLAHDIISIEKKSKIDYYNNKNRSYSREYHGEYRHYLVDSLNKKLNTNFKLLSEYNMAKKH